MTVSQIDVVATSKRQSEPAEPLGEFVALLLQLDAMRARKEEGKAA
jgi:hypothetical protein